MDSTVPDSVLSDLTLLDRPSDASRGKKTMRLKNISSRITTPFSDPLSSKGTDSHSASSIPDLLKNTTDWKLTILNKDRQSREADDTLPRSGRSGSPQNPRSRIGSRGLQSKEGKDHDAAVVNSQGAINPELGGKHHVNRKEVLVMKQAMIDLLKQLDETKAKRAYRRQAQASTQDMDFLMEVVHDEQQIFDTVFQEMIRQVTAHMTERGEILTEIRTRYSQLFSRIPSHVHKIYTESVAHRKLVKRLLGEIDQMREKVQHVMKDVEVVRRYDRLSLDRTEDLRQKIALEASRSEAREDMLEEYQNLSRMQRKRLEKQLQETVQERDIWMDSVTRLLLRVARDQGLSEAIDLHQFESQRFRAVHTVLFDISKANEKEMRNVDQLFSRWRTRIQTLSQDAQQRDQEDTDQLNLILAGVRQLQNTLMMEKNTGRLENDNPMLKSVQTYDAERVLDLLGQWQQKISDMAMRFSSDSHLSASGEVAKLQKLAEEWIDMIRQALYRCEHGVNGYVYHDQLDDLRAISGQITEWLDNIDRRISGENGLATALVVIQNSMDDRLNQMSARGIDRPLNSSEYDMLHQVTERWSKDLTSALTIIASSTDKGHTQVIKDVEKLTSAVMDQMNLDISIRTEESRRLHAEIIRWTVEVVDDRHVMGKKDAELKAIIQELMDFNDVLMKDIGDLKLHSDDNKNMKEHIKSLTESWCTIARVIVEHDQPLRPKTYDIHSPSAEDKQKEHYRTTAEDERRFLMIEDMLSEDLSDPKVNNWTM